MSIIEEKSSGGEVELCIQQCTWTKKVMRRIRVEVRRKGISPTGPLTQAGLAHLLRMYALHQA